MSPLDPRERDLVKCEDMRIHAERARKFMGTRSLEEFLSDEMLQAAVIRCVEVVGEAARQVSEDTRRRATGIPWAQIVGMRNIPGARLRRRGPGAGLQRGNGRDEGTA